MATLYKPRPPEWPLEVKSETSRRTSATYRQSMTDKGFVQVAVWVPAERKAELQQIATKMRSD